MLFEHGAYEYNIHIVYIYADGRHVTSYSIALNLISSYLIVLICYIFCITI